VDLAKQLLTIHSWKKGVIALAVALVVLAGIWWFLTHTETPASKSQRYVWPDHCRVGEQANDLLCVH
jgi:hypothetical protein